VYRLLCDCHRLRYARLGPPLGLCFPRESSRFDEIPVRSVDNMDISLRLGPNIRRLVSPKTEYRQNLEVESGGDNNRTSNTIHRVYAFPVS
jgi:hypothetical protein